MLFHRKAVHSSEAKRPQNAQGILRKALLRVSHRPQNARLQVGLPAERVRQPQCGMAGHGVHRKIPPGQVLRQAGGKGHRIRVAAVAVPKLHPVGGDLVGSALLHQGLGAVGEAGGQQPLALEHLGHLLRQGAGAQIPIVGRPAKQTVPHAAAHRPGLITGAVQPPDDAAHRGRNGDWSLLFLHSLSSFPLISFSALYH